jgi:hypothetical protein
MTVTKVIVVRPAARDIRATPPQHDPIYIPHRRPLFSYLSATIHMHKAHIATPLKTGATSATSAHSWVSQTSIWTSIFCHPLLLYSSQPIICIYYIFLYTTIVTSRRHVSHSKLFNQINWRHFSKKE